MKDISDCWNNRNKQTKHNLPYNNTTASVRWSRARSFQWHRRNLLQMQGRIEHQILYIDCINKSIQNQISTRLHDQSCSETYNYNNSRSPSPLIFGFIK